MTHLKEKKQSLRIQLLIPICLLLITQMALIFISIFASGLLVRLDESAAQVLGRTVQSRRDYLQYDMVNKWRETGDTVSQLDALYANSGQNAASLSSDANAYTDYLRQATPMLISMMRTNAVSGAFVILRGSPLPANPVKDSLTGIYIRDRDPSSVYNSDNKDLLFERAPVDVVAQTGITTDSYWTPKFTLSEDNADHRYFYNPYRAALENKDLSDTDLAYWSPAYHLNEEDNVISIAYSVPLIADDGTLYGVLGVEILTDYLIKQLPTEEITDNDSAYCLAVQQKSDGPYQAVAVNSSNYQLTQDTLKEFNLQPSRYEKCSFLTGLQNTSQMVAATGKLSLYNRNAPFSDEQWVLMAIEPKTTLSSLSWNTGLTLSIIVGATFIVSVIATIIITKRLIAPVSKLEKEVRIGISAGTPVPLTATGISELDSLAQGVEALNREVMRTAGKLTHLLKMSSINLGAFELDEGLEKILFVSDDFFDVFGEKNLSAQDMDYHTFLDHLNSFEPYALPKTIKDAPQQKERVYEIPKEDGTLWIRVQVEIQNNLITGFVEDISLEWRELRQMEYERNHDVLTGLMNRRAFLERFHNIFTDGTLEKDKYAALIMLDLDNLKYVNDSFGHEAGDVYIRTAATQLLAGSPVDALVARMSGDEFILFFYNLADMVTLQTAVSNLEQNVQGQCVILPEGNGHTLHMSAGVAIYPTHSCEADSLIRYADFAMYQGKRGTKGCFTYFDSSIYDEAHRP